MRSFSVVVLCVGFLFLAAYPSQAVPIIDTGTPAGRGWLLASEQWLAGEFTTTETHTIGSIEGYISTFPFPGSFTVALYTDGGDVPGVELLSGAATASGGTDWFGLTGLSHILLPGTYWVSFEVRSGDTLRGGMPNDPPAPLVNEAGHDVDGWRGLDDLDIGVRISSASTSVPEPSLLSLLALAGLGVCVFRQRR